MKKLVTLSICLFFCTAASAQPFQYQGEVRAGYAFGVGENGIDNVSVDMINGIRFNDYFSSGIGVGINYYFDSGENLVSLPLFLNLKGYYPLTDALDLFAGVDLGYAVNLSGYETTLEGVAVSLKGQGFLWSPSVGVSFNLLSGNAVTLGLCYNNQSLKATASTSGISFSSNDNSSSIGLKVGFRF